MIFRRSLFFVFTGALIVVISSCWKGESKSELLKGVVVVNVLEKENFDDCHIAGSINIPFMRIKDESSKKIDKGALVVMYCSNYMCGASSAARDLLMNMGYENVYVYEGGTAEWYQKGFPVAGPCKKPYLNRVIPEPEKEEDYVISAEELKKKME